jgi:glutamine cyclotransferase
MLARLVVLSFVTACVGAGMQPPKAARASYSVIRVFPHDRAAFTQGLEYFDGVFYEGTGLSGKSSIRKVQVETGEVLQRRDVAGEYFGEGITIWKNDLIELTWQSKVAFVYDRATFAPKRTFSYPGEGWGLTHDDTTLIMSDGSAALRFLDPVSFAERRRVTVTDGGVPVPRLNELEYVKGQVYANVWQTNLIARIAPDSGRVLGWIDLTGLLPAADSAGVDVMNGIAYDAAHDRLFVTGKLWPKVFEIKVR